MFSVLHFFGKPLQANSWDDESTGSSAWQPLSLSFRHFSLAELSLREVGAYLEEKKVVSLAIQRDDPPLGSRAQLSCDLQDKAVLREGNFFCLCQLWKQCVLFICVPLLLGAESCFS